MNPTPSELNVTYEIRDYNPETDKSLIMASWLKGLYYGNSFFGMVEKDLFMNHYKQYLEVVLSKSTVKVACLIEDKDTILGYSVLSPDFLVIHWIFVKKLFREKGIGKSLCPSHPKYFSHITDGCKDLIPKLNGAVFNPFAL